MPKIGWNGPFLGPNLYLLISYFLELYLMIVVEKWAKVTVLDFEEK